jgi:hypothetical protein
MALAGIAALSPSAQRRRISSAFHGPQNLIVQALGIVMIGLTGLCVLSWPLVASWMAATAVAALIEDCLLGWAARETPDARLAVRLAAGMRVVMTSLFAVASFVLIVHGGPGERLFAFAIVSAAMVHVLMRHYPRPSSWPPA